MTGWLRTSDRGLGKVGEWFERFVVPRQDDMVRAKPIGPFADRIVVYVLKRPDEDEVAVVFDVVEGKPVAQARLTLGGVDLVPLRLDDTHFVLPVEHPNPGCGVHDGVPDTCAATGQSVDVWQAWPPKRVARFDAPTAKDVNYGERVVTMQLPNQGSGPPKEKKRKNDYSLGDYAPTRIPPERLHARDGKESNVDEASEKVLFKKGLGATLREPSFGTSGSKQVLRAILGEDLVAWDVRTGAEVERWKHVSSYSPLAHGTLLAFFGNGRTEIARVVPPERLTTVQLLGDRPSALVTSPDGRFELLGDRQETAIHLRCRIGHVVLPFSACAERSEWPGLLKERLGIAVAGRGK